MVTTKLNLSMTEPSVRQIYAKQGDTGRVLDITLDQTPEDGTLRILRPDGTEVTSEAVTGGSSESGETVTFESLTEADVTELTVGIEPVQDLNGYDAPWVGGAGKNLLNYDVWKTVDIARGTAIFENNGVTLTATDTDCFTGYRTDQFPQEAMIEVTEGETITLAWDATPTNIGNVYLFPNAQTSGLASTTSNVGHLSYTIASGVTYLTFRVGVLNSGVTASYKNIQIVRGTTVPAWQPYSNICPITGHDEVRVTRTGKNLYSRANGEYNVPVYGADGSSASYPDVNAVWIPVKPNTLYTIASAGTESTNFFVRWINCTADKGFISRPGPTHNSSQLPISFRTPTNCYWVEVAVNQYQTSQISQNDWEISVVEGDSTSYEPYQGSTYTTSLGQTVYGGTLDLVSGVLTVDSRYLTVNDFTFMSSGTSAGGLYWVNVPQTYPTGVNDNSDTNVCSHAPYTSSGDVGWGSTTPIYTVNSSGYPARIYVDSTTYADFQTKYATLQAVYKLAEPVEYQLTAQQIKTLVGTNNVWASSGDIVNITFTYGGLLSELPSEATEIVGKCYCDVEQNGVSSMPFTLNVKKNERES